MMLNPDERMPLSAARDLQLSTYVRLFLGSEKGGDHLVDELGSYKGSVTRAYCNDYVMIHGRPASTNGIVALVPHQRP